MYCLLIRENIFRDHFHKILTYILYLFLTIAVAAYFLQRRRTETNSGRAVCTLGSRNALVGEEKATSYPSPVDKNSGQWDLGNKKVSLRSNTSNFQNNYIHGPMCLVLKK